MSRNEDPTPRWRVKWHETCNGDRGRCHCNGKGHESSTYLNEYDPGGKPTDWDAITRHVVTCFRKPPGQQITILRVWRENPIEIAARLRRARQERAEARRGIHWSMGGAN